MGQYLFGVNAKSKKLCRLQRSDPHVTFASFRSLPASQQLLVIFERSKPQATMVRPLAATALAAAALVVTNPIPTAEAAGKSYQKGHKVELWVSKVRPRQSPQEERATQDVLVFCFVSFSAGGSPVETGTFRTYTINGYLGLDVTVLEGRGENNRNGKRLVGIYLFRLEALMVDVITEGRYRRWSHVQFRLWPSSVSTQKIRMTTTWTSSRHDETKRPMHGMCSSAAGCCVD